MALPRVRRTTGAKPVRAARFRVRNEWWARRDSWHTGGTRKSARSERCQSRLVAVITRSGQRLGSRHRHARDARARKGPPAGRVSRTEAHDPEWHLNEPRTRK